MFPSFKISAVVSAAFYILQRDRGKMEIFNDSHCADLTAAAAIQNLEKAAREEEIDKRARNLMGVVVRMIGLAGFHLEGRLVIRHVRTGRKYGDRRTTGGETEPQKKKDMPAIYPVES